MQPLGLRIDGRRPQTAGNKHHALLGQLLRSHFNEFGRVAERPRHIGKTVPCRKVIDHMPGGCTDGLNGDGDRSFNGVIVADSQWDPFTGLVGADHQELPRERR